MRNWTTRSTPNNPMVGIVIAAYLVEDARRWRSLCCLIHALRAQTYRHWKALVVHDGPLGLDPKNEHRIADLEGDDRVRFQVTSRRLAQFGHPHRHAAAVGLECDIVGFQNDDNYICPVFLEALVHALTAGKADLAYCDAVHSHRQWLPVTGMLVRGRIDLGQFLVRKKVVVDTPWKDFSFAGDWKYIEALSRKCKRTTHVRGHFLTHN